ncbi:hypothetical protein ABV409_02900 [Flagellimonas sp. DF-77]|uniref:hypothetical protein n=1 Tax=Flagellimonas algarum TaxID=3230298 RepID=UPI003393C356
MDSKLYFKGFLIIMLVSFVSVHYAKPRMTSMELPEEGVTSDTNFDKMMDVLSHKRCVNCHPNDNIPKQGEDSHPHYFGMSRGEDNLGFEATKCTTCHQNENNDYSGVPGAPEWSLAPAQMYWEGLSRKEIAASMMDPERNGGRTPEETMHHLTEHALVLWAWEPGVDANGVPREKPPVPKEEYIEAVKAWFEAGAVIPTDE